MNVAAMSRKLPVDVEVLAFDVFGTVVDWHGSIVHELAQLHPQVDGDAFALAWRAGYKPAMARVMSGELGWTRIDDLHRLILDAILPEHGLAHLDEAQRQHLNRVWHRLDPWPVRADRTLTTGQFSVGVNKGAVLLKGHSNPAFIATPRRRLLC
jgi:hypothetical protein